MIISAVTETTFKPLVTSSDHHHHHHIRSASDGSKISLNNSNDSDSDSDDDKGDMFDFYDNEEQEIIALPPQGTLDLSFSNTKVTLYLFMIIFCNRSESINPALLQIIVTKGNAISRILTDVSIANILGHDCDSEIKRILTLDVKGINIVRTEHNTQKKIVTIPSTQLDMSAIEPFTSTPSHDSRIIIVESFRTKFKEKINVSVNYTDYNLLFTMNNTLMKSLNKPATKHSTAPTETTTEPKKSVEFILPPDTEFILDPQISVLGESTPSVSRLIGENKKVIPQYIESYLDICEETLNVFKSITDQTTQLSHY